MMSRLLICKGYSKSRTYRKRTFAWSEDERGKSRIIRSRLIKNIDIESILFALNGSGNTGQIKGPFVEESTIQIILLLE